MNSNEPLSAVEVAELLHITKNTVYELVKRGDLPGYKVGKKLRIDKLDVDNYISCQKLTNQKPIYTDTIVSKPSTSNDSNALGSQDIIIAGQDSVLDILAEAIKVKSPDVRVLRNNVGSYTNLYDLYNDRISICSSHLWDGDNNEYNLPYVRRLLPGVPCVLINIAYRTQGFYVAKGNPLGIKDWADLTRSDVSIINREKGCGTRILLDEMMRKLNIDPTKINGYNNISTSHLSVASAVGRGEGDLGIGIEKVALGVNTIDFVPIHEERYDLVIKKSDLTKPIYQGIIETIQSNEFKAQLEGLSGYDLRDIGKII
ncbi:MAG: helix-turn-helix transcriptional regulator [Clostridium sp.]